MRTGRRHIMSKKKINSEPENPLEQSIDAAPAQSQTEPTEEAIIQAGPADEAQTEPTAQKPCRVWPRVLLIGLSYFLVEVFASLILHPDTVINLGFGCLWACILTAITIALPTLAGRIFYGVTYYFIALWTIGQTGYYQFFRKLMWLSDMFYAGEGADYLDSILIGFTPVFWFGAVVLIAMGVLCIWQMPKWNKDWQSYLACGITLALSITGLVFLPELVFIRDLTVWGTQSDYMQSTSYRATYNTMYDAKRVYDICGIYQLTMRDIWKHELYPLTPAYRANQRDEAQEVKTYFDQRDDHQDNEMTGIFEGKNVVMVLMESMDDWVITPEDTPTLHKLMQEGINFTNFYTPGYGTVRTFNTEFCVNTGIFLPTMGNYAFDYVTNHYNESMANLLTEEGYHALTFHYNSPDFYSRGVFEPSMGYEKYVSFEDYTDKDDDLFNDSYFFENDELREQFFRDGKTFNFYITRSAHLSYVYNEVLSHYALKQYPEYKGRFGHEEIDCIRVKAKLVDDMFANLIQELKDRDQLENTVIIAFTDHYSYGFKDVDTMMELSGVDDPLLLEKTPCFIWSADGPKMQVDKTLNTSDLLPTVLNMLGIDSPYDYLGQDAFDPDYEGYALFPDGSWISDGVACRSNPSGNPEIIMNTKNKNLADEYLDRMESIAMSYIRISNLLLTTDYYKTVE